MKEFQEADDFSHLYNSDYQQNRNHFIEIFKKFNFKKFNRKNFKSVCDYDQNLKGICLDIISNTLVIDFGEIYTNIENKEYPSKKEEENYKNKVENYIIDFFMDELPLSILPKIVNDYTNKNNGRFVSAIFLRDTQDKLRQTILYYLDEEIEKILNVPQSLHEISKGVKSKQKQNKLKTITKNVEKKHTLLLITKEFQKTLINEIDKDKLIWLVSIYLDYLFEVE